VTGFTDSNDFPTTSGVFQPNLKSSLQNAFIAKLNANGTALIYSTYLGGSGSNGDEGESIAVDSSGDAFVTEFTYSTDFPTTSNAFQISSGGSSDAFVTELNPSGSGLIYSTFLGGSDVDQGYHIAVGNSGNVYIVGESGSSDFPTTPGA